MERTEIIMGMPITVSVPPSGGMEAPDEAFEAVFAYFREIDEGFSPFKSGSEVSRISRGELALEDASERMREVLRICEETERQTGGYFSAWYAGAFDPSGVVKGWAVREASRILDDLGFRDHCVDAGGDIEVRGVNAEGWPWEIGIRNPFDPRTIIKILRLSDRGIATSGTYIRGDHIYDPKSGLPVTEGFASLTLVGPDVCEADRLSTPAFAMGEEGLGFLATTPGIDAYAVGRDGTALFTPGLARYLA
jgi:thiamine biosynthesis lipoprotein